MKSVRIEANMEHLPIKLGHRILAYLDLYDLRSLMLVSKKLSFVVNNFKIDELIVHNSWMTKRTKGNWFYVEVPHNFLRMVSETDIGLLSAPTDGLIKTDQLRRLKLDSLNRSLRSIRPVDLNRFSLLEILDVDLDDLKYSQATAHRLFLPSLVALRVRTIKTLHVHFVTPRLKALSLCTYHTKSLRFSHPLSVVHLETYVYNRDLSVFTNVAYLECYDSLNQEIFASFPHLRTLRIESRRDPMTVVQERNSKDPRHLLKIYQFGVRLNFGTELDSEMLDEYLKYYTLYLNRVPFYLRNYNLLAGSLRYADKIDYTTLTTWIADHNNDIIRFQEFYDRFNDIRAIVVNRRVEDRYHLIRLIFNSPNLYILKLSDSRLDQAFFELLPEISCLFVLQVNENQFVGLRFEFVARMKLLHSFRTNQDLVLSEQFELDRMKHLRSFEFLINDRPITVSVQAGDANVKYKVRLGNFDVLAKKRSFAELIDWCDHFRKRHSHAVVTEYLNVSRPPKQRRPAPKKKFACTIM